jgi:chromatin remodeling complex protein RSC6
MHEVWRLSSQRFPSPAVKSVVEKFREKYGAKDVKKYYSKFDVAVVVASQFRKSAIEATDIIANDVTEENLNGENSGKAKQNSAFMKPMQPSEHLAKIVGTAPLPRTDSKAGWVESKPTRLG